MRWKCAAGAFVLLTAVGDHLLPQVFQGGCPELPEFAEPTGEKPLVVALDTTSSVYDTTWPKDCQQTNAHEVGRLLQGLPIDFVPIEIKGKIRNLRWQGEDEVKGLQPDLVILHYSAFHDFEKKKGFIVLQNFMRTVSEQGNVRFILYSRGPGFNNTRAQIVLTKQIFGRQASMDQVRLLDVGGPYPRTFKWEKTKEKLIEFVEELLHLPH